MCPYKKVHSRVTKNKWITKNIVRLIHERKCIIKRFIATRDSSLLSAMRILRNQVNAAVDKAKSEYVKNLLRSSKSNTTKIWRNIKCHVETENDPIENVTFKDTTTGEVIENADKCNFILQK